MTCKRFGGVIICTGADRRGVHRRVVFDCPTCERRVPGIRVFGGAWYADQYSCAACLDKWSEGERMVRPFYRCWKRDRAREFRDLWQTALSPVGFDECVTEELRSAFDYGSD